MRNKRVPTILTFVFLLFSLLGCGGKSAPIPESLVGTWKTPEGKYADRFLEISTTTITFGTGGTKSVTHRITGVKVEESKGKGELFTLYSKNEDGKEIKFSFYYAKEADIIRFKNQEQFVWRKEKIQ